MDGWMDGWMERWRGERERDREIIKSRGEYRHRDTEFKVVFQLSY